MNPPQETTPPTEPTEPLGPAPRRLTRSTSNRVLAGVSGGLGRHFEIDPLLFRIGFVILALSGPGVLLYPILWLLVPSDGEFPREAHPARRNAVVAGLLALLALMIGFPVLFILPPVGLILLALAAALLWRAAHQTEGASDVVVRAVVVVGIAVLSIGAGLAAAALTAVGGGAWVAGAVLAIGVVLVVSSFVGGARWLILPAIVLATPATVVSAADLDVDGGVGAREYRPQAVSDIRPLYELGGGELVVDLRGVEFPAGDTPVAIELGVGGAHVIVPEGLCVAARADIGAGHVDVLGRESGGLDIAWAESPERSPSVPRLVIDAEIGIGALEVDDDRSYGWDDDRGIFDHREDDDGRRNREDCADS